MAKQYFAKEDATKLVQSCQNLMMGWNVTDDTTLLGTVFRNLEKNRLAYESMMYGSKDYERALEFIGEQEELIRMKVPVARTRIRQFVSFMAKKKLAFEAITDVTDSNPIQTARLAKSVCDTLVKKQRLQEKSEIIAEKMLVEGMCFASSLSNFSEEVEFSKVTENSKLNQAFQAPTNTFLEDDFAFLEKPNHILYPFEFKKQTSLGLLNSKGSVS